MLDGLTLSLRTTSKDPSNNVKIVRGYGKRNAVREVCDPNPLGNSRNLMISRCGIRASDDEGANAKSAPNALFGKSP
jgi:hypothetical protein